MIVGGTVVNDDAMFRADVFVKEGKIAWVLMAPKSTPIYTLLPFASAVGIDLQDKVAEAKEGGGVRVIDARGKLVIPGGGLELNFT